MVIQNNILESGMNIMSKYILIKKIIEVVFELYFEKSIILFIF